MWIEKDWKDPPIHTLNQTFYPNRARKGTLFAFTIQSVAFFIYKGKYLDLPTADAVEIFDGMEGLDSK